MVRKSNQIRIWGKIYEFYWKCLHQQKLKNGVKVINFPGNFIKNGVQKQIFDLQRTDCLVR